MFAIVYDSIILYKNLDFGPSISLIMTKADFLEELGISIAKQRLKLKLTQTEVANICDIERGNLTRIEKGKSNVTAATLLKISEALDVPVSKFFLFQKKHLNSKAQQAELPKRSKFNDYNS